MYNYSFKAVSDFEKMLSSGCFGEHFAANVAMLKDAIHSAVKFMMPTNAELFHRKGYHQKDLDLFRLPYPVVVAEYDVDIPSIAGAKVATIESRKRIALAIECKVFGKLGALVFSISSVGRGIFVPPAGGIFLGYNENIGYETDVSKRKYASDRGVAFLNKESNGAVPTSLVFHSKLLIDELESQLNISVNDICKSIHFDTANELTAIIDMCCVLNCGNIHTEDKTNRKINKKRTKAGKKPFYTYKVLKVYASDKVGKKHDVGDTNGHCSPRVHIRRGHIRRLPSMAVWVNACVVGSKTNGMVIKDYQL